jgi:mannose-6-phosphate isomerase
MQPLGFQPLLKQIRWGGRKLGTVLNKSLGDAADYAESWEIADQPSGQSVVATGLLAGKTLNELITNHAHGLLGRHRELTQFPLLIKFLDAHDWLSLQVHPNDDQAVDYGVAAHGKTEAWVILDAEPGSQICAGLKRGVTRETFERHLRDGTIEDTLHMIPARAGDCLFIPAQTVHALGPGILLAEIQQQSDLTFRLHDWGRLGSDGKPRPLHIEQSLTCIDFERGPVNPVTPVRRMNDDHQFEELVRCEHFVIHRHECHAGFDIELDDRFRILMTLSGRAELTTDGGKQELSKGTTILLPAATAAARIEPDGTMILLEVFSP